MFDLEEKKYRVALLQPPAPPNDLGEMSETELYGYIGVKLDEAAAKTVLSELEKKSTVAAEFEGPLGLKTRVEIQRTEPK